ncbi:MAG: hypothetical protein ACNFW9_05740 [Candidatus Kerfeldbacteria bacterium]
MKNQEQITDKLDELELELEEINEEVEEMEEEVDEDSHSFEKDWKIKMKYKKKLLEKQIELLEWILDL